MDSVDSVDDINIKIQDVLRKHVGHVGNKLNNANIDALKESIETSLKQYTELSKVTKVSTLWASWSWKKKLYWLWKHKISGSRKEINLWRHHLSIIEGIFNEENFDHEEITDILCEIRERTKKWWYEFNPKSILIYDIAFVPRKSCDYIKLDVVVEPNNQTVFGKLR